MQSIILTLVQILINKFNLNSVIQGQQGIQGIQGQTGPQGPIGLTGATGPQGEIGPQGLVGATGIRGEKGDQGDIGPMGQQGPQGTKGDRGEKGDQGDTGAMGPQGVQGSKGDRGEKGDQGLQGEKGETGLLDTDALNSINTQLVFFDHYVSFIQGVLPNLFVQGERKGLPFMCLAPSIMLERCGAINPRFITYAQICSSFNENVWENISHDSIKNELSTINNFINEVSLEIVNYHNIAHAYEFLISVNNSLNYFIVYLNAILDDTLNSLGTNTQKTQVVPGIVATTDNTNLDSIWSAYLALQDKYNTLINCLKLHDQVQFSAITQLNITRS